MSLKAFHLIFVNALSALALGCAVWKFRDYFSPAGRTADLLYALGALVAVAAIIVYGRAFLKKMKAVGYL